MAKKTAFYFIIFFLVVLPQSVQAQTSQLDTISSRLDSIYHNIKQQPASDQKLKRVKRLIQNNKNNNLTYSILLSREGLKTAQSLQQPQQVLSFQSQLADFYLKKGNFSKGYEFGQKLLEKARSLNNKEHIIKGYIKMASANLHRGHLKDNKKYLKKALTLAQQQKDTSQIISCYNKQGQLYYFKDSFSKAITAFKTAIKFARGTGDKLSLANCQNDLGLVYKKKKQPSKAIRYYKKALSKFRGINKKDGIAITLNNISYMYSQLSQPQKALAYSDHALKLARKLNSPERLSQTHHALFTAYKSLGNYQKALHHYQKYTKCENKIHNKEKSQQMAEMRVKYHSKQKERQIQLLKKEKEIQTLFRNASIGGLILVLILAYLLYNRYRVKKRANQSLTQKNEIIQDQQRKIMDSINYAQRIQHSLLPSSSTIKKYIPHSFIFYRPRDIVSGDFYWFAHQGDKIIIAVADCTGHGVPGAFMSVIGRLALDKLVIEKSLHDPGTVLTQLHAEIRSILQQKDEGGGIQDGMDIGLCTIDISQQHLHYAGAQIPLYYIQNNKIKTLKCDKQGIGGLMFARSNKKFTFTTRTLSLSLPTYCYLTTDGYLDQFGGAHEEKFGLQQFQQLLKNIHTENMSVQEKKIARTIDKWKNNHRQIDDMLIVGFQLDESFWS